MANPQIPISFVGLGRMGLPIARRLAADPQFRVTGCDKDSERRAGLAGEAVASIAALAECAAIFTCLPNEAAVREVYLGLNGLHSGSATPRPTCDLSTISPDLAIEIAAAATRHGAVHVEAPMLGGVPEAEQGTLFLAVAAAGVDGVEKLPAPLPAALARIARKTLFAGPPGAAARMKVVQNGLGLLQVVGIAEALATCSRIGLDPAVFADFVIEARGMAGRLLFAEVAPRMLEAPAVSTASIEVAAKDAQLFAQLSGVLGQGLVSQASAALLARAVDELGAVDYTQVIRLFDPPAE